MRTGLWLLAALILVVGAVSVWYAFQSPGFVAGLVSMAVAAAAKAALPQIAKPMDPDVEKEYHACIRRGGEWDHIKRRCRDDPR